MSQCFNEKIYESENNNKIKGIECFIKMEVVYK